MCSVLLANWKPTKHMAEAIAESTKAPVFSIANSDPSMVEDFDMVILGTPVEGFRPAKETLAFVERLPKAEGKKAILFCTHALWKGSTFKILQRELASKGYETILSVSKKGMKPDKPADFSDALGEVRKVLEK